MFPVSELETSIRRAKLSSLLVSNSLHAVRLFLPALFARWALLRHRSPLSLSLSCLLTASRLGVPEVVPAAPFTEPPPYRCKRGRARRGDSNSTRHVGIPDSYHNMWTQFR